MQRDHENNCFLRITWPRSEPTRSNYANLAATNQRIPETLTASGTVAVLADRSSVRRLTIAHRYTMCRVATRY